MALGLEPPSYCSLEVVPTGVPNKSTNSIWLIKVRCYNPFSRSCEKQLPRPNQLPLSCGSGETKLLRSL